MGSFDANGLNTSKPDATGKVTDTPNNHASPAGHDSPFADTLRQMSSRPDNTQLAQAADASGILGGKTEKQYIDKAAHNTRKEFGLHDDAKSEDVFKAMGESGYKNFLKAHHNEQEEALKALGLTRENISAESMTKSMIEHRRAEENLPPDASLKDVENGMYKKFYRDVKKGTAPVDYD